MKKDRKKKRLKRKMKSKKVVQIYPMLPTKYNYVQRKELRKKEQELLKGKVLSLNL